MQKNLWFKKFFKKLKLLENFIAMLLFNDSLKTIVLTKNFIYKSKTKYMEIKWYCIKNLLTKNN